MTSNAVPTTTREGRSAPDCPSPEPIEASRGQWPLCDSAWAEAYIALAETSDQGYPVLVLLGHKIRPLSRGQKLSIS
jgi:hypothetical protein